MREITFQKALEEAGKPGSDHAKLEPLAVR
jgi:hypothetical protein